MTLSSNVRYNLGVMLLKMQNKSWLLYELLGVMRELLHTRQDHHWVSSCDMPENREAVHAHTLAPSPLLGDLGEGNPFRRMPFLLLGKHSDSFIGRLVEVGGSVAA